MDSKTVSQGNFLFFNTVVGLCFLRDDFTVAIAKSSGEVVQFSTDLITGKAGYIRIDSSPLEEEEGDSWFDFIEKIDEGILTSVAFCFGSNMDFRGDLSEKTTVEKEGFRFEFEICQYERDGDHNFEIVELENLGEVPDDEILGRVVNLKISRSES